MTNVDIRLLTTAVPFVLSLVIHATSPLTFFIYRRIVRLQAERQSVNGDTIDAFVDWGEYAFGVLQASITFVSTGIVGILVLLGQGVPIPFLTVIFAFELLAVSLVARYVVLRQDSNKWITRRVCRYHYTAIIGMGLNSTIIIGLLFT